jgi:hypothetical protein
MLDTAAGLEAVQLRLGYDASALQIVDVKRGTLTGGFDWLIRKDEPGVLHLDMAGLRALDGGSGSLFEVEFQVKPDAQPGMRLLDVQWVSLNDGGLTLNPEPQAGQDPTDGSIVIAASPKLATFGAQLAKRPATLPPHEVLRTPEIKPTINAQPVIAWSRQAELDKPKIPALETKRGWISDFVNGNGQKEEERKPNDGLRLKLPKVAAAVAKGLSKLAGR